MSYKGVLHKYNETQVAFELPPADLPNVLIMIGGMTDGLLTVPYAVGLSRVLEPLGYSVVQIQMRSSYLGWGTSSLSEDVEQIRELVDFLRSDAGGNRKKIVLMGHSTGSQDVMLYMLKHGGTIDAGILQGSCSDREAAPIDVPTDVLEALNDEASKLKDAGKDDELLPSKFSKIVAGTPISVYRWCSIMLPKGDDDYFSSDIPEDVLQQTFGKLNKPFLIAYSAEDEFVPTTVDKVALLRKWREASNPQFWSRNSGLVAGASHAVKDPEAQKNLFQMVTNFFKEFGL